MKWKDNPAITDPEVFRPTLLINALQLLNQDESTGETSTSEAFYRLEKMILHHLAKTVMDFHRHFSSMFRRSLGNTPLIRSVTGEVEEGRYVNLHGFRVIILKIEVFEDAAYNISTDGEIERMEYLFTKLTGTSPEVGIGEQMRTKMTKAQVDDWLQKQEAEAAVSALSKGNGPYSGLLMIMSSHGKYGSLKCSDGKYIYIQNILRAFSRVYSGCPKIFIFHACRGNCATYPPRTTRETMDDEQLKLTVESPSNVMSEEARLKPTNPNPSLGEGEDTDEVPGGSAEQSDTSPYQPESYPNRSAHGHQRRDGSGSVGHDARFASEDSISTNNTRATYSVSSGPLNEMADLDLSDNEELSGSDADDEGEENLLELEDDESDQSRPGTEHVFFRDSLVCRSTSPGRKAGVFEYLPYLFEELETNPDRSFLDIITLVQNTVQSSLFDEHEMVPSFESTLTHQVFLRTVERRQTEWTPSRYTKPSPVTSQPME